MNCEICAAPALPMAGACVFCRSPLRVQGDPRGLLDYLSDRLPHAEVKRRGLLGRGGVREVSARPGGELHRIRLRRGELVTTPDLEPVRWADSLVRALSREAAADPDVRAALSHAGWDPR